MLTCAQLSVICIFAFCVFDFLLWAKAHYPFHSYYYMYAREMCLILCLDQNRDLLFKACDQALLEIVRILRVSTYQPTFCFLKEVKKAFPHFFSPHS